MALLPSNIAYWVCQGKSARIRTFRYGKLEIAPYRPIGNHPLYQALSFHPSFQNSDEQSEKPYFTSRLIIIPSEKLKKKVQSQLHSS